MKGNQSGWPGAALIAALFGALIAVDVFCIGPDTLPPAAVLRRYVGLLYVIAHVGIVLIPCLLFGRWSKILYIPLWMMFSVLLLAEGFALANFGMRLEGEWVEIVCASSWTEVREFLGMYVSPSNVLLLVVFLVVVLAGSCALFALRMPSVRIVNLAFAMLLLLPSVAMVVAFPKSKGFYCRLPTMKGMVLAQRHWQSIRGDEYKWPDDARIAGVTGPTNGVFAVFVIGESATRSRWSLYGYARPTTPRMDALKDDLYVFKDLVTPACLTPKACRWLFTDAEYGRDEVRCSFCSLCSAAGLWQRMVSSQDHWSTIDGFDALLFSACDEKEWLADRAGRVYDEMHVNQVAAALRGVPESAPCVLYCHLMGSHVPFSERCPDGFTIGWDDPYDRTIAYTDCVLGAIVEALRQAHRPSVMVYVSDHGENTVRTSRFRNQGDRCIWEVPFIVWTSKEYRLAYPEVCRALSSAVDRPLQSDQLFPAFAKIVGISDPGNSDVRRDPLASEFEPRNPRMVLYGNAWTSWEEVKARISRQE